MTSDSSSDMPALRAAYRELLLGCGRSRIKKYSVPGTTSAPRWTNPAGPTTLDLDSRAKPDVWCDLNAVPPWVGYLREDPLGPSDPALRAYGRGQILEPDSWDEIHAYQVLEHLGRQGDAEAFFAHFSELWRLLRSGGYLVVEVPSRFSGWLWGDPGHTRVICEEHLVFLNQPQYVRQCERANPSSMSDYRYLYRADFDLVDHHDNRTDFVFILRAVKPSRWEEPTT